MIVRENTEDLYAGVEFEKDPMTPQKLRESIEASTDRRSASTGHLERLDLGPRLRAHRAQRSTTRARQRPRKVTAAHKANIMKFSDGLFLEVAAAYPRTTTTSSSRTVSIDNLSNQPMSHPEEV